MKRIAFVCAALALACAVLGAQNQGSAFSSDLDMGIYYNARPLSGSILDIFLVLAYLRGGATADFEFAFAKGLGAGAEAGLMYITFQREDESSVHLVDLPLRAKASLRAGSFTLEAFAGAIFGLVVSDAGISGTPAMDAGGRIALGPVFLEASYVLPFSGGWEAAYPRFGAGWCLRLLE